jgi:hypothetical protein
MGVRNSSGLWFVVLLLLAIVGITGAAAWLLIPSTWPHRWLAIVTASFVIGLGVPLGALVALVTGLD